MTRPSVKQITHGEQGVDMARSARQLDSNWHHHILSSDGSGDIRVQDAKRLPSGNEFRPGGQYRSVNRQKKLRFWKRPMTQDSVKWRVVRIQKASGQNYSLEWGP
jgi:hypothetical protein